MAQSTKNLLSKIKSTISFKRVAVALVVAITIFLPTTFAIVTVLQSQFGSDDSSKIHTVSLYDNSSRLLFFEDMSAEVEDENSLVDIFTNIKNGLESINENSIQATASEPLTVELISDAKTEKLVCYFSMTGDGAYCTDEAGKYYAIQKNDNELFLGSQFAETLYGTAIPPLLSTADSDTVAVCDASWSYTNRDGAILSAQKIRRVGAGITYIFSESISLSFEIPPDSCSVQVFDGEERIYCTLESLDNLTLKNHSGIRVLISAKWDKRADRDFFGTATYDFNAEIHNRSEFIISTDKLRVGEFAFIKITEVSDASKLSFKSNDSSFSLNFVISGEEAYAILPWSLLEGKEIVDFTLNYGASSRSFTLSAAEPFKVTLSEFKATAAKSGITPSAVNLHPLKYVFFTSASYSSNPEVFEKTSSFGDSDKNNNGSVHFCDTYVCKDTRGASVGALVGGKVIAVGSISDSKYVVIDSGLGIRMWYLYLSVSDVSVGDVVSAGGIIGKTGELEDGKSDGFCVAASFEDTFINPSFILK